jgi:hypothetical protein
MPVDPKARVRISAFNWVPPFAQGYVRDLRVRWALEEAGIPYGVRKLDAATDRPADYFAEIRYSKAARLFCILAATAKRCCPLTTRRGRAPRLG